MSKVEFASLWLYLFAVAVWVNCACYKDNLLKAADCFRRWIFT